MASQLNIVEIPGLISKKIMRKIVFANTGVIIEKPLSFDPNVFIPCENISAFRFGVQEMRLFKITLCTRYFIETRDYQNKIFRIKLNSSYGIKRKEYYKAWADLLEYFWNFYMVNQLNFYTELFHIRQIFELSGVTFHTDGISWDKENKLKWSEIVVNSYQTHFVISHTDNPNQSKCFMFATHWNAAILQYLLKDIIKQPVRVRKSSWL